ncbi:PIN domain-containing protein [Candidatus Electronema sp. JM]|uniref:PIN domain-containing protein n=1 Tax=Candidatus Electronema sp. JM TaxID=3401571 RepID=UPI003AA9BFE2
MNVLLDTNVVLDFVLDRQPFAKAAELVFETAKRRPVQFYLSATTVTDLFYIAAKAKGKAFALALIKDLLEFVEIAAVNKTVILDALHSGQPDFEDAVQAGAAKQAAVSVIVTRNAADFAGAEVDVCHPDEFLRRCS